MQAPGWILRYCAGPINHPPLFFLLLHGWLDVVPTFNQGAVESLNLVFSLLTLGVFYRWIHFSLDERWAGGLTFLLALHPFHVYYSGELRMYALAAFGLTVAMYFATRLLMLEKPDSTDWTGWFLGSLVAIYTHSFVVLPVMVILAVLGMDAYRKSRLKPWGTSVVLLAVVYLPWSIFVLNQALRISGDYWLPPFRWEYLWTLTRWMGGYVGPKAGGLYQTVVDVLILLGLVLPLGISCFRWDRSEIRLSGLAVMVPVLGVTLVSLWGQSVFLYRVFLPLLPAVLYLVVWGLAILPRKFGLLCLVAFLVVVSIETVQLKNHPPNQYVRQVADWIEARHDRGTVVLHTSARTYFPARFYHANRQFEFVVGARKHLGVNLTESQLNNLGRTREVLLVHPAGERPGWLRSLEDRILHKRTLVAEGREYGTVLLGGSR